MTPNDCTQQIIDAGVVAVVRTPDHDVLRGACEAIAAGGVTGIEITMSVPGAIELIAQLADEFGDRWLIGAGSVRDAATARDACKAGAKYIVSPVFVPEVIDAAHEAGAAACCGAFSPTEIHNASQAGADIVKVFPADQLGQSYFKAVLAPMPELKLMPTGGVTLDNGGEWINAGAVAVGVGSALLKKDLLEARDWTSLERNARTLKSNVDAART